MSVTRARPSVGRLAAGGGGTRQRPVVLVSARPMVRRLVTAALTPEGFRVALQPDRTALTETIADLRPDLLMIEAISRPEIAGAPRSTHRPTRRSLPLIVVSTDSTPHAAREALDAGADDYVVAPFDPSELAARARSLIRRRGDRLASGLRGVGYATVDLGRREVIVDAKQAPLSRVEWRLLLRLLADEGRPVAFEALAEASLGWEARGDTAALREAIGRLRRKLGASPGKPGPIRAIRGFGYQLGSIANP